MDVAGVIKEVETWSFEQRVSLLESLWDRLIASGYSPELDADQRSLLDSRLQSLESNPDEVIPWEQVQAEAKRAG